VSTASDELSVLDWGSDGFMAQHPGRVIPNHPSYGTPSLAPLSNRLMMVHQGISFDNNGPTNLYSSSYLPH
jgi:hypothetical protein